MTISFVPGEVNKSQNTLVQVLWKKHHVIVYGSGNNLIISVGSDGSGGASESSLNVSRGSGDRHLQTVYLPADPTAIAINPNGVIAVGYLSKIVIYRPNEYISKPQWIHVLEIDHTAEALSMQWAVLEDELVVGSPDSVSLYHLYDEYGTLGLQKRWQVPQANPVTSVKITRKGDRILSTSGPFDRLVKVWSRVSYGDNTLFELSILDHPKGKFVVDYYLRTQETSEKEPSKGVDGSMANIKNIRGYIDTGNDEENDVIYTLTNDNILQVWASYEFNGHAHIRSWASIDLSNSFYDDFDEVASISIVENFYFRDYISTLPDYNNDLDILLVISKRGKVVPYTVSNISANPPNNIKIQRINKEVYHFSQNAFPSDVTSLKHSYSSSTVSSFDNTSKNTSITPEFLESQEFLVETMKPIVIPSISYINDKPKSSRLSILIHDRMKNTVRFNSFNIKSFFSPEFKPEFSKLLDKFQGHTKSIRKLAKSSGDNILFSISNFPEHNYLWEPLLLQDSAQHRMTVTKRFCIDVTIGSTAASTKDHGVWNAVILNDVGTYSNKVLDIRRHLVVILEKDGSLSLWDCDGLTGHPVGQLIKRLPTKANEDPKAFVLTEVPSIGQNKIPQDSKEYCIVAIFGNDVVLSWKVRLDYTKLGGLTSIEIYEVSIPTLPQSEKIHQISSIDSVVSNSEKSLVSVIDKSGHLRILAIDFANSSRTSIKWKQSSSIHTNVVDASKIQGTAVMNKLAIINRSGNKLTIWDIKTGVLEYEETYPESYGTVRDLDWTFINSSGDKSMANAIFSVGFARFVLLYTQLRYDYTNNVPTFAVLKKIDVSDFTSHEIGDSIWLENGYLVIGSGNQFFIDDNWVKLGSDSNPANSIDSTIRQLMTGYTRRGVSSDQRNKTDDGAGYNRINKSTNDLIYNISHLVRILNGPLPVYHPQFLIQCLFMNQVKLVQDILVSLFQNIRRGEHISWDLGMDMGHEMIKYQVAHFNNGTPGGANTPRVELDFSHDAFSKSSKGLDIFNKFNSELSDLLVEKLMKISLPLLTRHQQSTLISIINIAKDLKKYSLSVDSNGIRFLIGFKLFQASTKQPKLSMRDINWALHSDNKELLLSIVEEHYKHNLKWENIKQTGLVFWVETPRLVKIIESAARNEFSDSRDPSGRISLFYLALQKKQILIGLWKTVSHVEQQKMLKFLSNDFTQPRWKSAALKNAFVLLGKHRYVDAACFFLLAGSVKDACSTLANKVNDVPLAIVVSKIYSETSIINGLSKKSEWSFNGTANSSSFPSPAILLDESLISVIENYILPEAVSTGDRWTTSWIFWQLGLKESSIQALIRTPIKMVQRNKDKFSDLCNNNIIRDMTTTRSGQSFLRDDPVLIILFNELRNQKSNYLKGSLNIDTEEEAQFIIKVCMIYTRMGCDYLAILLLRNWSFIHETKEEEEKLEWNEPISSFLHEGTERQNGRRKSINPTAPARKAPAPPSMFEEPDMSSFDFGF